MLSKIIINRTSAFMNRARKYKVFIDGKEVGQLKNDSGEEYIVEPGTHAVQCKIDWCSSPEMIVQVPENGAEYVRVDNGLKLYLPMYILLIAGLIIPLVFRYTHTPIPDWLNSGRVVFSLLPLIYMMYNLSVGRKKYLAIKRDETNPFSSR